MGNVVNLRHVCDVCKSKTAAYDAQIPSIGSWAFLCKHCFEVLNCELGLGKGQELDGDEKT